MLGGRYRILGALGEGGMGVVYSAMHVDLDKRFAVKVLRAELGHATLLEQAFRHEARAASRIGHPNIVEVSDFGRAEDGSLFMVMEYLEGESLRNRLERTHTVPVGRGLRILLQVAQALGAAHERGIVHRDVKPDNVMLLRRDEDDFIKVLDFGLAHALGVPKGTIWGTPQYMPPEQATGGEHDHRVDIFAFGVLAYETLSGSMPYEIRTPHDVLLLAQAPLPPALGKIRADLFAAPALSDLLLRCVHPMPDQRPASMQEVQWALIAAGAAPLETLSDREARRYGLTPSPQQAPPRPPAEPAPMPARPQPQRVPVAPEPAPQRLELAFDPRVRRVEPGTMAPRFPAVARFRRKLWRTLVRAFVLALIAVALYQAWHRGWWDQAREWLSIE